MNVKDKQLPLVNFILFGDRRIAVKKDHFWFIPKARLTLDSRSVLCTQI